MFSKSFSAAINFEWPYFFANLGFDDAEGFAQAKQMLAQKNSIIFIKKF